MSIIVSDVGDLTHNHLDRARRRLRCVSNEPLQILRRTGGGILDLTASHGVQTSPIRRDWTFPSTLDSISCQYRELWVQIGRGGQSFQFENVQFHLLQHIGDDEPPIEIVAFHWHLRDANKTSRYDGYGHRPHLHLRSDVVPLRASHFGVTLGVPPENQASVDYLDSLLDDAARMLGSEVLSRLSQVRTAE